MAFQVQFVHSWADFVLSASFFLSLSRSPAPPFSFSQPAYSPPLVQMRRASHSVTSHTPCIYESRTPYLWVTNCLNISLPPHYTQTSHPPCIRVTHSISTSHELFRQISPSTLHTDKSPTMFMSHALHIYKSRTIQTNLSLHITHRQVTHRVYESRTPYL